MYILQFEQQVVFSKGPAWFHHIHKYRDITNISVVVVSSNALSIDMHVNILLLLLKGMRESWNGLVSLVKIITIVRIHMASHLCAHILSHTRADIRSSGSFTSDEKGCCCCCAVDHLTLSSRK